MTNSSFSRWKKAIRRLEEAIKRFSPADGDQNAVASRDLGLIETRYLLAKAYQRSAELPRQKLEAAETDNARARFRGLFAEQLGQSTTHFLRVQEQLLELHDAHQLDGLGREMLRNCYFELPDNLFALAQYERAALAYSNAATRHQQRPETLRAFVQMANCFDRLKQPVEARSALTQARILLEQNQIPDEAFSKTTGGMTREQWEAWLKWAIALPR